MNLVLLAVISMGSGLAGGTTVAAADRPVYEEEAVRSVCGFSQGGSMKAVCESIASRPSVSIPLIQPSQAVAVPGSRSGDVSRIFKKYGSEDGVDVIRIGSFMMSLMKMSGEEPMKWVDRIHILCADHDEADEKIINAFSRDLEKELAGYEKMVEAVDEGDSAQIFVKFRGKDQIRELVIVAEEEDETSVIAIKGKIPLSEISDLVKMTEELNEYK